MAEIASSSVILAQGRDVSNYFKTINVEAEREVKDSTALGHASRNYNPSLASRMVSGEGFWETNTTTDVTGLDRIFTDLQNTGQMIFSLGQGGAAAGAKAIMMKTFQSEFKIDDITPGELKMMQFVAQASSATESEFMRGVWLYSPATAATTTTNGTTYDTTTGGTGWGIHVHVVDGDDSATVVLEHSTNGSTWADLDNSNYALNSGTFTSSTTDTVNRYVRITVTPVTTTNNVGVSFKLNYTG